MAVLRFESGLRSSPKMIAAGPEACWLWFCGIGYCRDGTTDGYIPREAVEALFPKMRAPYSLAAKLVAVGLWEVVEGGYVVHDFHDWNPSKADVKEQQEYERNRKRKQRAAVPGLSHRDIPAASEHHAGAGALSAPLCSAGGSEPSAQNPESASRARGLEPVWTQRSRANYSPLVANHPRCYPPASAACSRGVCVPGLLVTQWVAQFTTVDEADAVIRIVVERGLSRYPIGRPIGDDPWKLWRAEWEAYHGARRPTTSPKSSKPTLTPEEDAAMWRRAAERVESKA